MNVENQARVDMAEQIEGPPAAGKSNRAGSFPDGASSKLLQPEFPLQGVYSAARPKFTGAKVEGLRSKRRAFEVAVALEKLDGCAGSRIVLDAAQGDVRVE